MNPHEETIKVSESIETRNPSWIERCEESKKFPSWDEIDENKHPFLEGIERRRKQNEGKSL